MKVVFPLFVIPLVSGVNFVSYIFDAFLPSRSLTFEKEVDSFVCYNTDSDRYMKESVMDRKVSQLNNARCFFFSDAFYDDTPGFTYYYRNITCPIV